MRAASLRIGQLLNQTELGRDVGLPQPTVRRYLNVLETSYQLVRLEPFSVNRTKRLIKTPKIYWSDTGLAHHLPVEVKASDRVRPSDTRHLRAFLEEYPDLADAGVVLHTGETIEWIVDGVLAVPWWRVL